jgi:hypothetical protein
MFICRTGFLSGEDSYLQHQAGELTKRLSHTISARFKGVGWNQLSFGY